MDNNLTEHEIIEPVGYDFGLKRRSFMQFLGAGLLVAAAVPALAQQRGGRRGFGGSGAKNIAARIHFGTDGSITVMVGKVEAGQGARAELSQAAAEELHVSPERIRLIMADTTLVPDDGITAGSGTTPRTVPSVRQASAAARELLITCAAKSFESEPTNLQVLNGAVASKDGKKTFSYAELAKEPEAIPQLQEAIPSDIKITSVSGWKVLGTPSPRPNAADIVKGTHQYPSDINLPGMLYGKVLRPPSIGAKLSHFDSSQAKPHQEDILVTADQFVGVASPSQFQAGQALEQIAKCATWETATHPSSKELYSFLKQNARSQPANPFASIVAQAKQVIRKTYNVAYIQHAPLEPRAAVAEWKDGNLTVWAGTQNPFGHRAELARAFHLPEEKIRVIVPDFGAGFGGKHTGEASVEAARLAQGAGKPVCLRWTREEEFTWAYFRPAAVIEAEASLDESGKLSSWHFININSGASAIETPYHTGQAKSQYIQSEPPLRHGSYRGLAATANNFARESLMDELAAAAGTNPLEFRLAHLESGRLRDVLEAAARRFDWKNRSNQKNKNTGVGLACGTEKGSYVAACVELEVNPETKKIKVLQITQTFECGAIINPENLLKQVQGAIIMGLGGALREEIRFENGSMLNASFRQYQPPRFDDVPTMDIELLNRPDLASAGAGETPIIAVAPAIANAVFHVTGLRIRSMPIRLA